jgi:hypothetical protein
MMHTRFPSVILTGLIWAASALAAEKAAAPIGKPYGYGAVESGQFMKYKYQGEDFRYGWRQRAYVVMGTQVPVSERLTIQGGLKGFLWYNTFPKERNGDNLNFDDKHVSLGIDQAEAVYRFGDLETPGLEMHLGQFAYKYNPDVRNLGEYMFRTGAYPNFIQTDFDYTQASLTGILLRHTLGNWHNDLIVNTETDLVPYFDMNLSYLTHYSVGKFMDVGAGVSFTNLISVDESKTTPNPKELPAPLQGFGDAGGKGVTGFQYKGYLDGSDTAYYTFRSTKLNFRVSFNLQSLFESEIFGPEDLKLYSEAALLGVKNYPLPIGYEAFGDSVKSYYSYLQNRSERMPVMLGFNIPTFKAMDVLSLEMEWYGLKSPDSYRDRREDYYPLPQSGYYWKKASGSYSASDYGSKDNLKWSLYGRKTLLNGLQVVGQVARDHLRHNMDSPIQLDEEEALTKSGQWWWALKLAYYY